MITLSLCVIVKNEEAVLGRMLESAAPVADEIIIADTGSTDRTKAIAASYTNQIYDFPWCQDFSAARNFACSKASMDYWMWLDADDILTPRAREELLALKASLDPSVDMVMMKYVSGFDESGRPAFSYYRERLIRNGRGFLWKGRVHEAVPPCGNILWSPIEIEHRKNIPGDPDRNLRIYEAMIRAGETLEPRHQYYYGRELLDHGRRDEAIPVLEHFLALPGAWAENQIDACLLLSRAYEAQGRKAQSLEILFKSFLWDRPRAEICCGIGRLFQEDGRLEQAVYWYREALRDDPNRRTGAFVQEDYYRYIPLIQLCVCYDRLGDHRRALHYHRLTQKLRPQAPEVLLNEAYFSSLPLPSAPDLFNSHIV